MVLLNKNMDILTLITFLLFLMPSISSSQYLGNNILTHRKFIPKLEAHHEHRSYAVIFDAGSSGSRVHVYHFDQALDLIKIGDKFEYAEKNNLGLSSFETRHRSAASSLMPLLEEAERKVDSMRRPKTPVIVGATAGLRLLEKNHPEQSDRILDSVELMLHIRSNMKVNQVKIISGTEEGAYMWTAVNYLKGNLVPVAKTYDQTIGIIELGGASVQMAYALESAPADEGLKHEYIQGIDIREDKHYDLYVKSYLGYGGNQFREKTIPHGEVSPCRLVGEIDSEDLDGDAGTDAKYNRCREKVINLLPGDDPPPGACPHGENGCTIGHIWNGGNGGGLTQLFATGSFYYVPSNVRMIPQGAVNYEVNVERFEIEAKKACRLSRAQANDEYHPTDSEEPFLPNICADLTYQYVFLTEGLKLPAEKEITLGSKIMYKGVKVEAAWSLGTALVTVSKLTNFNNLVSFS